ncbi:hypothetical protein VTL71DRAFT_13743 [Oculimacula yallundae]|uniref:Uncharacterized protein n=1 Tax=Oculimacula yallundae TaxID=86028 RepID=A0ABR4CL93_9HELO
MARMVCRIKYRRGEPLGLTKYPAPSFTSFPLEIRNKIYKLLLTDSEPIVVYTKSLIPSRDMHDSENRELQSSKVAAVTFGLLKLNRQISIEAAAIFYHDNVFRFGKSQHWPLEEPWDAMFSFFLTIGPRNRSYVRYVEAEIPRSKSVSKLPNGTVSSMVCGSLWLRKVHAKDQHTRIYPPAHDEYIGLAVDHVSPAIEAVFRLLGPDGSDLKMSLLLSTAYLPGATFYDMGEHSVWSGEIPDHIERMRRQFTGRSGGEGVRVDVQWKATIPKTEMESQLGEGKPKSHGWDVLDIHDLVGPLRCYDHIGHETCATFRRRSTIKPEGRQLTI